MFFEQQDRPVCRFEVFSGTLCTLLRSRYSNRYTEWHKRLDARGSLYSSECQL